MNAKWSQTLVGAAAVLATVNVGFSQTNPLLPAGIGSGTEYSGSYVGNGSGLLGRGKGPVPQGGDANPAETLLRKMDGTHYGRYTGHAFFRGQPVQAAQQYERASSRVARSNSRSAYYGRRGEYENSIYSRQRSRYRSPRPAQNPQERGRLPDPRRYY